ncbi:hypothetical protein NPIL_240741 [Nephila pilipes]|uniref:Uncharacterized protein n=1 Tax=Nephila pilipes TaxID=299642 RepID=A0A8X6UJH8_NEPPI|nr:hypothetical protein NPIL_240741 [Nephila pilipes]
MGEKERRLNLIYEGWLRSKALFYSLLVLFVLILIVSFHYDIPEYGVIIFFVMIGSLTFGIMTATHVLNTGLLRCVILLCMLALIIVLYDWLYYIIAFFLQICFWIIMDSELHLDHGYLLKLGIAKNYSGANINFLLSR